MRTTGALAATGIDAAALKPREMDLSRATALDTDGFVVDYEGPDAVPDADTLGRLAADRPTWVTVPVRADGFDPLGDDSLWTRVPDATGVVLVAGNPAYLSEDERERAVAPRLGAARERAADAWVGTEGVERVALAAGGTQFELLSRATEREFRALRAAGFEGGLAVYAPTVLTDDEDAVLDAVGDYAARRGPVQSALPESAATDASATGQSREVLSRAVRDYALVGSVERVRERVRALRDAGADRVVGYPARGLAELDE